MLHNFACVSVALSADRSQASRRTRVSLHLVAFRLHFALIAIILVDLIPRLMMVALKLGVAERRSRLERVQQKLPEQSLEGKLLVIP